MPLRNVGSNFIEQEYQVVTFEQRQTPLGQQTFQSLLQAEVTHEDGIDVAASAGTSPPQSQGHTPLA